MKLNEINSKKKFDFSCIYLWTNLVNGKHYVGQAISFYNRMRQYKNGKFNKYMKNAINKYGIDNFDITILEKTESNKDILTEREQYWLDYYESYNQEKGYNICQFAETTLGFKHSQESKDKISKKVRERYSNPEYIKRFQGENNPMYGSKHTDEWKEQHSKFLKDKWKNDEEYREFWHNKMSGENNHFYGVHLYGELNGMYGKKHSEETKNKISMANKGKIHANRRQKIKCLENGKIYFGQKEASEDLGCSLSYISEIINGRRDNYKGYHLILLEK